MKQTIRGSFTVEATFIMPIVIGIIFILLYLTFYLHDVCKVQGVVNSAVHKASLYLKHDSKLNNGEINYNNINRQSVINNVMRNRNEEEASIKKYILHELEKSLFLIQLKEINIAANSIGYEVSVEVQTRIVMYALNKLFARKRFMIIEGKSNRKYPADFIRRLTVIMDLSKE